MVVPVLVVLLLFLALLIKLFEWLGLAREFTEFLKALWRRLRSLLGGEPEPQEPEMPDAPGPENPPEDHQHSQEPEAVCALAFPPLIPGGMSKPVLVPNWKGGGRAIGVSFHMVALFGGCCGCCEYRQEIKGHCRVRRRGSQTWENVGLRTYSGAPLSYDFQEDGNFDDYGNLFAYGHRSGQPNLPGKDEYLPSREDGCLYRGSDFPNVAGLALGDHVDVELIFRGRIIDHKHGNVTVWQNQWVVKMKGSVGLRIWFKKEFPFTDSDYIFIEE